MTITIPTPASAPVAAAVPAEEASNAGAEDIRETNTNGDTADFVDHILFERLSHFGHVYKNKCVLRCKKDLISLCDTAEFVGTF